MSEEKTEVPVFKTNEQRKAEQQDKNAQLKSDQLSGVKPAMIEASEMKGQEVRKDEVHLMHVDLKTKRHDAKEKKYHDETKRVKYPVQLYQSMVIERFFNQYDGVKIVHDARSADERKAFEVSLEKLRAKQKGKK